MSQHEDEVMGPSTQSPEGPFVGMPPMPMDPADWIALLQNMVANQAQLQALLMNQANAPQQLASFNNMNMIKFSDPTRCYTWLPWVWARPIRAGRHQVSH